MKLQLDQITFDESIYPRMGNNGFISFQYSEEMKAGANFPPIVVALIDNKYILVDGKHRSEAYKVLKVDVVEVEVLQGLTKAQAYIEAVNRNSKHGYKFSISDKVKIMRELQRLGLNNAQIQDIIHIKADKIDNFISDRITNTLTGETVILKRETSHFAGQPITTEQQIVSDKIMNTSLHDRVRDIILLIDSQMLDLNDKKLLNALKTLKEKIEKIL